MNRTVSEHLDQITPDALPSSERQGPARALFIHGNILGFRTVGRLLTQYCAERDDLDAVHVHLRWPTWMRVLGKGAPFRTRGWDMSAERFMWLWGPVLHRWFHGPLDLNRFDVVHVLTQGNARAVPRARRDFPRVKFAVNADATAIQQCDAFGFSKTAKAYSIAQERRIFDSAHLVATRNAWAAESLRDDYGLPEDKIHIASNSVPLPDAHRWDGVERETSALPRIVFVGSWVRKGGDVLLRVHQECFADRAELHVFSSVPRPDRSAKNVVWHGLVERDELLNRWLPSMDLFVLPSRDDMLPWAALEACAAGLPVVASAVGAIPHFVIPHKTGALCEPSSAASLADAMEPLIADGALRETLGRAAREFVRVNHNPDVTYPALLARIASLADEGGAP